VKKNLFIIVSSSPRHREYAEPLLTPTPLVVLLVASIVMTAWSMSSVIHLLTITSVDDWQSLPQVVGILWPYFVSLLLPSVLDLILTGILLHYLTRTMKRVYAPHNRKRITRLVSIVWQSALPPTLCTITTFVLYFLLSTAVRMTAGCWFSVIQAMIGKLYVLSLIHIINAHPTQPDERPTLMSTLTVPAEALCTSTRYVRDDVSDMTAAERRPEGTPDSPV